VTASPDGVGVDAPLWWSSKGSSDREADRWIRKTYRIASGTVQAANSLKGAALVQGAMFVQRLREKFPGVRVTETHPKAVAIALGGWNGTHVANLVGDCSRLSEHERDACLAALLAREGFSGRFERDLSLVRSPGEQDPNSYWLAPVHYFWPLIPNKHKDQPNHDSDWPRSGLLPAGGRASSRWRRQPHR
jgi:predicted nuclease with RNAse H fold